MEGDTTAPGIEPTAGESALSSTVSLVSDNFAVAIIVAAVLLVLMLCVIVYCCCFRRSRKSRRASQRAFFSSMEQMEIPSDGAWASSTATRDSRVRVKIGPLGRISSPKRAHIDLAVINSSVIVDDDPLDATKI